MKREIETIFGLAYQNNSGGYIIQNDDVDGYVATEAINENDLHNRFVNIVEDNSEWCECCGPRWQDISSEDWNGKSYSLENFKTVDDGNHDCILHMLDGTKKKVKFIDND